MVATEEDQAPVGTGLLVPILEFELYERPKKFLTLDIKNSSMVKDSWQAK